MPRGAQPLLVSLVAQQVLLLRAGFLIWILALVDPALHLVRQRREVLRRQDGQSVGTQGK